MKLSFIARSLRAAILSLAPLALSTTTARMTPSAAECRPAPLPNGFRSAEVRVNGATLSYVIGGSGPPLILIHGFPEDHSAWGEVMKELSSRFTIVAPDLRGVGRSIAPPGGPFDALTLSEDVRALASTLHLSRPFVVGHDMGGIVAYTLGRAHSDAVRGVMLVENPLPGIAPWDEIAANPKTWHINFHQSVGTPELLIAGREAAYFQSQFFAMGMRDPSRVDAETLQRYACAYTYPSQLAAGLGQYRATPVNAAFNRSHTGATKLPLILVGGERALGRPMIAMAAELRGKGWLAITLEQVPDGSHYMLDEDAGRIAALIRDHAGESR